MSERYDPTSARHYAAYRPPLHALILERLVHPGESFGVGLDIGCGTGHSTLALARHCGQVIGLEPSRDMLARARTHPGVTYLHGSAEELPRLSGGPFDVVTLAGSLFYTKTDALRRDLTQVCIPAAAVLVYDFEIRLDPILDTLGIAPPAPSPGVLPYDHSCDLTGWPGVQVEMRGTDNVGLDLQPDQLAHLLLSDSHRHDALSGRFPERDLFDVVEGALKAASIHRQVRADLFFSRWRLR